MTARIQVACLVFALGVAGASAGPAPDSLQKQTGRASAWRGGLGERPAARASVALPARLSDREFWRLVVQFSEPDGYFDSDNLVSNEDTFQTVVPELRRLVRPGGVYLGVGPDQNFTYIVAVRPALSFITDVRRGNLHVHLMYKALIELSVDRADFLSRLFSRRRPAGLGPGSTVVDLFRAYRTAPADRALYEQNAQAIVAHLTADQRFPLADGDRQAIAAVYAQFAGAGPDSAVRQQPARQPLSELRGASGRSRRPGRAPRVSWRTKPRSASSRRPRKRISSSRSSVTSRGRRPCGRSATTCGLMARPSACSIRPTWSAISSRIGLWMDFAGNVAALPLDESSTFIRSCFDSCSAGGGSRSVTLLDSMTGLLRDAGAGRISTYRDVLFHSRGR